MSESIEIPCAKAAVSHVIGKGGCVIKQLQTHTGASISVITAEDGPRIRISGTPDQIEAARAKVQAIIEDQAHPSIEIPCAKAAVSHVIGKGGCVIKQLQTDTGAAITTITAEDGPRICISGTPDQIERARAKVQSILDEQANPDYAGPEGQRLRDAADAAAAEREKLKAEADAAFKAKDRSTGFAKMEAAKAEGDKMRQLSQEAAIAILRHRNDGKGDGYLDLHGLRTAEALDFVAERIALLESYNSECPTALEVIAGAGHHSANGKAALRPAVAEWLKAHKFDFEEISAGTFVVQVPALGRPMRDENKTSRSVAAHPTAPHQTTKETDADKPADEKCRYPPRNAKVATDHAAEEKESSKPKEREAKTADAPASRSVARDNKEKEKESTSSATAAKPEEKFMSNARTKKADEAPTSSSRSQNPHQQSSVSDSRRKQESPDPPRRRKQQSEGCCACVVQ